MDRRTFMKSMPALAMLAGPVTARAAATSPAASTPAEADKDMQPITLPKHETNGGKSVLAALQERRTNRNVSDKPLPPQVLSNLLWAAFGVNREQGSFGKPGRTAPSASNSQEIDLYIALPEGVYLYEAVGTV
jgi:hypothetical protein